MHLSRKQIKNKKSQKHSSLTKKWVSLIALTIASSFIIFSLIIYSVVSHKFLDQQLHFTQNVTDRFEERLSTVPNALTNINVTSALSLKNGHSTIDAKSNKSQVFDNSTFALLSNQDIDVVVFNTKGDIVFSKGTKHATLPKLSKNRVQKIKEKADKRSLVFYQKIYYAHRLTGYLMIKNAMTNYNNILLDLRSWMIIASGVAIILFIIIASLIIRSIVAPLNAMSKVARAVVEDPNSTQRIPNLHRNDELGELAFSFNQMLDRMQGYIKQQKQFVGDVSHELRTPIAVIQGHLNLIKRWGKNDPQVLEESIDASLQEADRMKHLIQEMLDLTRAEQIDVQYPNAVTDVNNVLTRVIADMQMVHPDFQIRLDDDLPDHVKIKMFNNHFEQLLIILIDNAIKYSTTRKEVIVSAALSNDHLHVHIQDFGEGIPAADRDKIFNRFYRVDKARTREKGGNGLGLSIAKKLTQSYHGKISVVSIFHEGSTFELVFPIIKTTKGTR